MAKMIRIQTSSWRNHFCSNENGVANFYDDLVATNTTCFTRDDCQEQPNAFLSIRSKFERFVIMDDRPVSDSHGNGGAPKINYPPPYF